MSYTVVLLCLVLIGAATSETTTETPPTTEVSIPPNEEKATLAKSLGVEDDNSTDIELIERDEGDPPDDEEPAESQATFKFSPIDAKNGKQWTKPPKYVENDEEGDGDVDTDIMQELTSLMNAGVQLMNSATDGSNTTVTTIKEQDDDSEEDGELDDLIDDDDDVKEEDEDSADSKPEESQIKRQDEPENASSLDFEQPNRKGEIPAPPQEVYVTVNDQPDDSNSENDNSPLLQLTQGGYRSPYIFNADIPRVRSPSASQQSETVENPSGNVNNAAQFRQPQISPQVSYADPFQSQFGFSSALGLRHPFIPPDSFVNSNGMVHQPVQNGFFNAPPAGFTDFTGTNFQAPFSPSNDGGFQVLQRNPSGISLFQTPSEHVAHNPGYMVQNQQYPQTQFLAADPTQTALYQTPGFLNYPGSENANAAQRPDYSPFYRSTSPNNLQFQVNNNPFAPPRSAGGILYNPMMQFQPHFPNRPQYSPQYPALNQQVQVQSIATDERKPSDSDKIDEGETTKTEEQVNASPNKEDSPSVPFGVRIPRPNSPEPQGDFPPQSDVFMRYPVKEAGYATEESLPIQNTTAKTETKIEAAPPRQIFSFFPTRGQFGDPYRNALNSLQRGFPTDSNVMSNDNNNDTKPVEPEQIPQRIPFPFSPPSMARPIPGYPDSRNPNTAIRPPSFFGTADGPVDDPFNQLPVFSDQYPAPLQTGSQSQETSALPACVHGQANATVCFEDPEYPKRDVLFALSSDPYLMDRFSMPDQQLDTISLVEQDSLEHPESPSNYICNSQIRYGFPLRAKDVNGQWKVIVNIEKGVGQGRFVQPVRLEVCKGAGDPCNFTQVKTACVQKYNLHRLLSWSPEKGVHNDVFKLPVACSCQLIDGKA